MPSFSGNVFILGCMKLYFGESMYYEHHLRVYLCQKSILLFRESTSYIFHQVNQHFSTTSMMRLTLTRKSAWHPSLVGEAASGCGCALLQQKRQAARWWVCAGGCAWERSGQGGLMGPAFWREICSQPCWSWRMALDGHMAVNPSCVSQTRESVTVGMAVML